MSGREILKILWPPLLVTAGIVAVWGALAAIPIAPPYILPSPWSVAEEAWAARASLAYHTAATATIVIAGLILGAVIGAANAISLVRSPSARRWLMPILIAGQAVPVFALAPLLTQWFGFGVGAKLVMMILVVYFPVTASFYDGLRRADPGLLDAARVLGADDRALLWGVRVPGATPALVSGLRLAAVYAPIAAVFGEWTGGQDGLGYLMNYAKARTKADLLFAALFTLAAMGISLHALVSWAGRRLTAWAPDSAL